MNKTIEWILDWLVTKLTIVRYNMKYPRVKKSLEDHERAYSNPLKEEIDVIARSIKE